MNDYDDLHALLTTAVGDIEPADRLDEIRSRTRQTTHRSWYVAGGAMLTAAAAITAIAVVGTTGGTTTTEDPVAPPPPAPDELLFEGYYLGDTARGPRLFLERRPVPVVPPLEAAVAFLEADPVDPDYRSSWSENSFGTASAVRDVLEIELTDASLRTRPAGMDEDEAAIAVEQVVRTLQLAAGSEAPVQFRFDGNPIDQVLGVPTSEPISPMPVTDTYSLMSIAYPQEGEEVSGELTARGLNNGQEATMEWTIEQDGNVVLDGFSTADGWMEERLWPWETAAIDLTGLEPGTYTFVATNPDPSGGAEGFAPDVDTKTIEVEGSTESAPEPSGTTAVYYVGAGPDGPDAPEQVLYRYFEPEGDLVDLLTSTPSDPDYSTLWKAGNIVSIGDPEAAQSVVTLRGLPLDRRIDQPTLQLALQQLAHSVSAYYGEGPLAIRLMIGNEQVGEPFEPSYEALSRIIISDPAERLVVTDDSFTARGLANGFEGTVACYIRDADRDLWVEATIAGWQEEKLFPWELEVDLSDIPPGTYTFLCSTDDPTGGVEGRGADTDTRTIVVE